LRVVDDADGGMTRIRICVTAALRALAAVCAVVAPAGAAATPPAPAFFRGVGGAALEGGAAPGIALAVVHKGRIVYEGGFGKADVASGRAVTADTRFAAGSLSKQFTAAAILLLTRERKLSVDDALAKFFPALPNAQRITLRMLLNQTSGLHNYPLLAEHPWPTQGRIPVADLITILATDKPDFAPGTKYEYSNANYAVLAAVAEKASGMPFGTLLRERVFAPLHMRDSGFGYEAQARGGVATGYAGTTPFVPPLSLDLFSGAGGVVSTAHDMALWDAALMSNALLSESERALVWTAGRLDDGSSAGYAMGWIPTQIAGHREVWHNGLASAVGGYCYNAIFPDDDLAVIVLTNGSGAAGLPEHMVREVAAAFGIGTAPPAGAPTPAPGDDPKIDALARSFWDQLASGTVDRSRLSPAFADVLTPELSGQVRQGITSLGALRTFTFAGKRDAGGVTLYRYTLVFADGAEHEWNVGIGPDGRIAGSRLVR
jgi:CubicO group peptidase (beta-lactamase class C family)